MWQWMYEVVERFKENETMLYTVLEKSLLFYQ